MGAYWSKPPWKSHFTGTSGQVGNAGTFGYSSSSSSPGVPDLDATDETEGARILTTRERMEIIAQIRMCILS
ncbi:MAG: hypothetical protein CM1200mP14_08240 [Gammaproteobacteria bacterium]|nr:MAG: hypothetical protein CM1200mP14_08240 [Gammaproteobacteria bacterium]